MSARGSANVWGSCSHLGEALGKNNLVALLNEVAEGESIASSVAGCEALVGHVEEGEELLLLYERM